MDIVRIPKPATDQDEQNFANIVRGILKRHERVGMAFRLRTWLPLCLTALVTVP